MKLNKEIREFKTEEYLWLKPGEDAWVELDVDTLPDRDGDVFIRAKIDQVDIEKRTVICTYEDPDFSGQNDVHITRIMKRDPKTYPELADLVDMPVLNDAELHQKIRDRFARLDIFTYIGPSLLIINPFKYLKDQYKESLKKEFYDCIMHPGSNKVREKPPHVWAIAANAYLELYNNKMNQACCISGESGAGKTVNTKTCMSFLTGMNEIFGATKHDPNEPPIEDKILMCNPILEALGNAKTVRNDNSSRFGKYVSLFMANKIVIGASVDAYLLEAIRVTTPNKSERNYHVFYQFLKGATDADIAMMRLVRKPFNYTFLERSGCSEVPTVDDVAEYNDHEKSMKTLNLMGDWREGYWRIIASVLHLSNIRYDDSNYNGSNACEVTTINVMEDVISTLMVDKQQLLDALTCRTSVVMGKEIVIYLDKAGCTSQCEAFGKDIYSKLFTWVIKYLNLALLPAAEKASGQDPAKVYQKIGLLDIFGFEIFENNSIEQLCINFTNEKLHQLYVEYVFKLEVQTFVDEGLKQFLANLSFKDNQEVLDLLAHPDTKKFSVFNLIDDQAATMSKDLNLIDQFQQFHGKNSKMMFSKTKRNIFYIVHTARAVGYTIDGFCEKNKDEVPRPIIRCVLNSRQQRIVDIYCQKVKDTDTPIDYLGEAVKKKESFIGYKFRQQMDALMTELRSCQCSFMRCIKPNEAKSATIWTSSLVVLQIRYLGLLDSIKIRKESYPFRFQFKTFVHKYLELEPTYSSLTPHELDQLRPDYKQLAANIVAKGIPEHTDKTQLSGKTRVFLKIEAYQNLEEAYEKAVKVKKDAVKALDKVLLEIKLLEVIQNLRKRGLVAVDIINQMMFGMKTKKSHRNFKLIRKVALKLQANFRAQKALREFRKKKQVLSNIQCAIEAFVAQRKAREKITSGKTILRYYKNYKLVSSIRWYVELLRLVRSLVGKAAIISDNKTRGKAATTVQKYIRGFLSRKENAEEVKKVVIAKQLFKYNKAMKILKKYIAGKIARRRIRKVMTAAAKIQAYFKMRWTKRAFKHMKNQTVKIQRAVRTWLDKKRKKDSKRIDYLRKEYIPFLRKCCTDQSRLYDVNPADVKKQLGKEVPEDFEEPKVHKVFNQIPEVDQSCLPRVRLYTEVFDLDYIKDILSLYQGSWAKGYIDSLKDSKKIKTDARVIEVGSRHTLLATINGRCYCWGTNDQLQLGTESTEETMAVFRVLKGEEKLRGISAGDEHTHILTRDRSLFSFGRNDKGQLGLGHTDEVPRIELNTLLTKAKLKSVHSKKQENYAVTEEGELMFWPVNVNDCRVGILRLPQLEKANIVSLGSDFAMVLTDSGNLFSFGRENRQGQLGLGHLETCLQPTHVNGLVKERIVQVSCGHSHTLALTRNSKIYAWGAGRYGQLGTGEQTYSAAPLQVKMPTSPSKPLQVCSSVFGSYSLYEDGTVYWWGKNSRVGLLKRPALFRTLEDQDLFPIQIRSSWSESLSVSYFEIADFRYVKDLNTSQKHAQAKLMANKWNTMAHSQCRLLITIVELPISNGYGTYLTAKNYESSAAQDLQRMKPDPLASVPSFNAIFMSEKDFRSPAKPIKRAGTSPGKPPISPSKMSPTKASPMAQSSAFLRSPATPSHSKPVSTANFFSQPPHATQPSEVPKSFEKVSMLFSPEHRSDKRQEREKKTKEGIQVSQYVSSTRRDQEKTSTQKIEEMMKNPTRKAASSGLNPHQTYT